MIEHLRFRHIIGIAASIIFAAGLSAIPLYFGFESAREEAKSITVFFVFVLAFLMNNSMQKSQGLLRSINMELSRLRRLHHVVESLGSSAADKKLRKEVEAGISSYRAILIKDSFSKYETAHKSFRRITHAVYRYKPTSQHGRILLEELFDTTRELAATRQSIISSLSHRISSYGWTVLLCTELFVVLAVMITQGASGASFFGSFAILAVIFMLTILVREIDTYSKDQLRTFGRKYKGKKHGVEHA